MWHDVVAMADDLALQNRVAAYIDSLPVGPDGFLLPQFPRFRERKDQAADLFLSRTRSVWPFFLSAFLSLFISHLELSISASLSCAFLSSWQPFFWWRLIDSSPLATSTSL